MKLKQYKSSDGTWYTLAQGSGGGTGGSTTGDYIPEDGWTAIDETLTYASATSFTVATDLTARFQKGTKLKLTQTTDKYFYVTASSYGAPNTTVTITGGTDYTLASAAITTPFYSYIDNPAGFPDWFNYTPTLAAGGSMTISLPVIDVGAFSIKGRTVYVFVRANFTLGGTPHFTVTATLPIECGWLHGNGNAAVLDGSISESGYSVITVGTPDVLSIRRTSGSNYTTGAGKAISVTVFYLMQ